MPLHQKDLTEGKKNFTLLKPNSCGRQRAARRSRCSRSRDWWPAGCVCHAPEPSTPPERRRDAPAPPSTPLQGASVATGRPHRSARANAQRLAAPKTETPTRTPQPPPHPRAPPPRPRAPSLAAPSFLPRDRAAAADSTGGAPGPRRRAAMCPRRAAPSRRPQVCPCLSSSPRSSSTSATSAWRTTSRSCARGSTRCVPAPRPRRARRRKGRARDACRGGLGCQFAPMARSGACARALLAAIGQGAKHLNRRYIWRRGHRPRARATRRSAQRGRGWRAQDVASAPLARSTAPGYLCCACLRALAAS